MVPSAHSPQLAGSSGQLLAAPPEPPVAPPPVAPPPEPVLPPAPELDAAPELEALPAPTPLLPAGVALSLSSEQPNATTIAARSQLRCIFRGYPGPFGRRNRGGSTRGRGAQLGTSRPHPALGDRLRFVVVQGAVVFVLCRESRRRQARSLGQRTARGDLLERKTV
jgi:hypothetical protein